MPKKGALWRKREALKLRGEELEAFLKSDRCSSRMARAIYEELPPDEPLRGLAITSIWEGHRGFLWSELQRNMYSEFGDWVVIALARGYFRVEEVPRLISYYEEEGIDPMTRGSILYALSNCLEQGLPYDEELREICAEGLRSNHEYTRTGATWLAEQLGLATSP